jgi:hypothetical protein
MQHISREVTVKAFTKCCISTAVDWTDDMTGNDSAEDGNVRRECYEDEGTEDGDSDNEW